MFNPEPIILELSYKYLSILFMGTIFVFLNSALRAIMQALGDTRTPLYIFGASNILNMILAPTLVFVLRLGIRGAALAAVISTIFSFVLINYILIKRIFCGSIKSFISSMKLEAATSIKILKIGGWACIQQLARPLTGMLMVRLVYQVGGKDASAAFGAGDTFPPMLSSLTANVIIKLPLAYILALSFKLGSNGVWISIALSVFIEAVMIIYYFKKGNWKERKI